MNQHHQIKLIALLPAHWTLSGTQEGKELGTGEYITRIQLIARTCACMVDSTGNDKEQSWKHGCVYLPIYTFRNV